MSSSPLVGTLNVYFYSQFIVLCLCKPLFFSLRQMLADYSESILSVLQLLHFLFKISHLKFSFRY